MSTRSTVRTVLASLGLGAALSALALVIVGFASAGYALREPQVVAGMVAGGPLLALATAAVWTTLRRRIERRPPPEIGVPPPEPEAVDIASADRAPSVARQVGLLACGVALSIPVGLGVWSLLLGAAHPLRGAGHVTELGTSWHDHDRTVKPLIGVALAVLGGVGAIVLVRCGGSRPFAIGMAVGCVAVAALMGGVS